MTSTTLIPFETSENSHIPRTLARYTATLRRVAKFPQKTQLESLKSATISQEAGGTVDEGKNRMLHSKAEKSGRYSVLSSLAFEIQPAD